MTVQQLREILSDFAPSDEIVLAKDEEGNGFRLANGAGNDEMFSSKEQNVYPRKYHKDYFDSKIHFKEVQAESVNCIVIW